MGKLKYRGNHIYYDFYDQHGKRQRPALGITVEKRRKTPEGKDIFPIEAHRIKDQIDKDVLLGTWGMNRPSELPCIKLQDAFDLFIKPYTNENTKHVYELAFRKLKEYFNDIEVESITEDMMLDFRNDLQSKYKPVTVEIFIRHIKIFLRYVEDEGYIRRSPVTKRVRLKPVETDIVIFSDPHMERFFKDLKSSYLEAYYQLRFLYLTGWRVSDSCELTWAKVDHDRMVIKHYIGKTSHPWEYPMDAELSKFLEGLPKTHKPHVFLYRDYHSLGHIFREIADQTDEKTGEPIIPYHKDVSIHTLRKQFTWNCFRRGVPLEVCSKLLGHKSVRTTEKYYTYWDTHMLREGLETSRKNRAQFGHKKAKRKRKKAV